MSKKCNQQGNKLMNLDISQRSGCSKIAKGNVIYGRRRMGMEAISMWIRQLWACPWSLHANRTDRH